MKNWIISKTDFFSLITQCLVLSSVISVLESDWTLSEICQILYQQLSGSNLAQAKFWFYKKKSIFCFIYSFSQISQPKIENFI